MIGSDDYGGGSVVKSGLLERVKKSLSVSGVAYAEWGGVKPNPRLANLLVMNENADCETVTISIF